MVSESAPSPRFFVLAQGALWSRYDVEVEALKPVNLGEGAADCPKCGSPVGMMQWLPPYRADLVLHGEELGDFIKVSGDDLLFSERFVQAFREEGLTGLEGFHPLEVVRVRRKRRGPKPSHVPQYLVVTACYGGAAVDLARSRIRYADEPPTCKQCREATKNAIHGFTLEAGTWRGEDIFRPWGLLGRLVVSERFARFVERHGFTNMTLVPTEELVWDPLELGPPTPKQGSA